MPEHMLHDAFNSYVTKGLSLTKDSDMALAIQYVVDKVCKEWPDGVPADVATYYRYYVAVLTKLQQELLEACDGHEGDIALGGMLTTIENGEPLGAAGAWNSIEANPHKTLMQALVKDVAILPEEEGLIHRVILMSFTPDITLRISSKHYTCGDTKKPIVYGLSGGKTLPTEHPKV